MFLRSKTSEKMDGKGGDATPAREDYTVAYLSDWPEFIPQVAHNCFTEWPGTYEVYGIKDVAGVEADYRNHIAKNENNTKIGVPLICFATRKQEGGGVERVLCGSCVVEQSDFHDRHDLTPWVTSVFVVPEFRRKGVARLLMMRALEVAKGLGYPHLWLWTEGHHGSFELYKKCGFVETEATEYLGKKITIMKHTF